MRHSNQQERFYLKDQAATLHAAAEASKTTVMAASWPGVSLRDHSAALLGPNGVVVIMEVSHELDYSIADCIHAFSFNATFLCSVFFQPKSSSMHAFKWTVQRDFRPPCFSSF